METLCLRRTRHGDGGLHAVRLAAVGRRDKQATQRGPGDPVSAACVLAIYGEVGSDASRLADERAITVACEVFGRGRRTIGGSAERG